MDYYRNLDHFDNCTTTRGARGIQYSVVTDLVEEPIDVDFFKQHARIDYNVDDNLCEAYIKAARQELEKWSQLSFGVKTMRLRALELPENFRLMFGKVDTVTTPEFTNVGDILKEGGNDIDIEFTTLDWIDETIKIAIARFAGNLYINREIVNDTQYVAQSGMDEAKEMIQPYKNITIL